MSSNHESHARIFKAFCDEQRLRILEMLRGGEKCACVLLEKLDIGQSTLSYHMKMLCESGIVISRTEGKWTHYRISERGSRFAISLMEELTRANYSTATCCTDCSEEIEDTEKCRH